MMMARAEQIEKERMCEREREGGEEETVFTIGSTFGVLVHEKCVLNCLNTS